jgi:Tol biopolymer transport system component
MRKKSISFFSLPAILTAIASLFIFCSCQSPQGKTSINYPSPLPDTTAILLLPGIVSKEGLDFNAAFSPDGNQFYFSRSGHGKYIIMESSFKNGKWNEPEISSAFDTMYSNTDPFFTEDGHLYFISNRPANATDTMKDYDIYKMVKQGDRWNTPERLHAINSDSTEYYVSVARNGNIYFASYRDGNLDLYMSKKEYDLYLQPVNLGHLVNSSSDEHDPLIAPDERYLIFTSTRPGGAGEADLYISFKQDNQWQAPQNMGVKINTAMYEYCPNLSPDGKYFLFSSEMDVKWISTEILKRYR